MHIGFLHQSPLPVRKYGGTERIIFWLMKELVRQGHEVSLLGHASSEVKPYGINHLVYDSTLPVDQQFPKSLDILHLFTSPWFQTELPFLVTIEGNGRPGETFHPNTVFVSQKHASLHDSVNFVYNGLDLQEYPFSPDAHPGEPGHFLFLAKASWKVKNLNLCYKTCLKLKKHLHIAGGRKWTLSPYIHSYGMVGGEKKIALMHKTQALLFPVLWHEPFGIAIIEMMAMGKPVIGSPYGSLPELVVPEAGRICSSQADFIQSLNQLGSYSPKTIRAYVESQFSSQVMAKNYLSYYEKVLNHKNLGPAPKTLSLNSPEELIPFP